MYLRGWHNVVEELSGGGLRMVGSTTQRSQLRGRM